MSFFLNFDRVVACFYALTLKTTLFFLKEKRQQHILWHGHTVKFFGKKFASWQNLKKMPKMLDKFFFKTRRA